MLVSLKLDDGTSKVILTTKGTLNDVNQKVRNFLDFVDGLPVKDTWVDKIRDLITKLKQDEREKANYMTFQMKLNEEREEGRKEERRNAIVKMIRTLKNLSIEQPKVIEQLVREYSLTQSEAQAAVQANW